METLNLAEHGVTLVPATKRHARELSRVIRAKEKDAILATGGSAVEPITRASINLSLEAYAAYCGDDLLAVFGVRSVRDTHAVWALTSVHVERHPMTFWRCSKAVVHYLRGKYPLMWNMIHGKYPEALRWVERLGFKLSPPEPFGPRGDLFCCAALATKKLIVVSHV